MEMKVQKDSNDVFLLEISGPLDLLSSNQLKEQFIKLIESKIEYLIIDLIGVSNINSPGIGALIYISSTLRKLKCPLIIVAPEGPVLSVLELTRLKNYFTVVPTVEAAMSLTACARKIKGRR